MTPRRSNVVPFERPAAYWARKARRHASPAQLPDAAKLMRKALEKSGDSGLALELSQIYARMHCYTASERYLMRACAREGLSGELSFFIGCAALNRGDEDLGERAIDLSLRLEPDGWFSEQAQEILETYPWRPYSYRPRCFRGEALRLRSQAALSFGRREEALSWAKKAWARARTPEIAKQLGILLPPRRAMVFLSYAARAQKTDLSAWLLLAVVSHRAGAEDQALFALSQAKSLCETITDAEKFCQSAWSVGQNGEALGFVREKLEKMPLSVDYLYLQYLCLLRLRRPQAAGRTLEMLLEIDPDDVSALRCRRNPGKGALDPERRALLSVLGSVVYAMPDRLRRGRLNRVLHMLVMTLDGVLSPETIYRLLPPVWRRMSKAEKFSCDEGKSRHYPMALTIYLLLVTGRMAQARSFFQMAHGKKRILRFLRRALMWNAPSAPKDD